MKKCAFLNKSAFFWYFFAQKFAYIKFFCTFAVDLEMRVKPQFKNRSRAWGKTLKLPNRSEAQ